MCRVALGLKICGQNYHFCSCTDLLVLFSWRWQRVPTTISSLLRQRVQRITAFATISSLVPFLLLLSLVPVHKNNMNDILLLKLL